METKEYRTVDKSEWIRGEWDHEPDKMQWPDAATGLPCLIVRGPSGALCGYVGIPATHPWHGKDYDQAIGEHHEHCEDGHCWGHSVGSCIDVHGGLTFADSCTTHGEEDYREFMQKLEQRREEAKRYPEGDAARAIKRFGGLDYPAWKALREASAICHAPAPGEPDNVWWFGFDCAHSGDICPSYAKRFGGAFGFGSYESYKGLDYVKAEVAKLATQLASVQS